MKLDDKLRLDYLRLYGTMKVVPTRMHEVVYWSSRITERRAIYEQVAAAFTSRPPWFVIGIIHLMEAQLNFGCHLHNGDPLTARTKHYPPGCPVAGHPPFTWEQSALDALKFKGIDFVKGPWDIPFTLYSLESYNGFGYRMYHPEINSPYLWAGTNQYTKGKYVGDGKFDHDFISHQIGAAPVLQHLVSSQSEQTTKEPTQ